MSIQGDEQDPKRLMEKVPQEPITADNEVSTSSAEGVVRPARREPHFLNTRQYAPLIRDGRLDKPGLLTHVSGRLDRGGAAAADGLGRGHTFRRPDLPLLTGW